MVFDDGNGGFWDGYQEEPVGEVPWGVGVAGSGAVVGDGGGFESDVRGVLDEVFTLLVEKNRRYGNSALEPIRVFSRAGRVEQLLVRVDDKLRRVQSSGLVAPDEDTLCDLLGYLVLLRVALRDG